MESTRTVTVAMSLPSDSPTLILEPNTNRDGFVVHNLGGPIFVKLTKWASSSNFTYRLSRNCTLEHEGYNGAVTAIAADGISDVLITELI